MAQILPNGTYRISTQAHVNHYLTSSKSPIGNLYNATGTKGSKTTWELRYNAGDDSYTLFHQNTNNALDLRESRIESGTNVIVYGSTENPNQRWRFSETATGAFVVTSVSSPHLQMAMTAGEEEGEWTETGEERYTVYANTANSMSAEHQWIFIDQC